MKRKKITTKQMKVLKKGWQQMIEKEEHFYGLVTKLETQMSKETGIKDLEFFKCDGEYVGIGNYSRSLKLINRNNLEK